MPDYIRSFGDPGEGIALAGEYTEIERRGFQAAVRSGIKAANKLSSQIKQKKSGLTTRSKT